jgi:hypothetical protein
MPSDKPEEMVEHRDAPDVCLVCGVPYRLLTGEEDDWIRRSHHNVQPPPGTIRIEWYACECDRVEAVPVILIRKQPAAPQVETTPAPMSRPTPAWKKLLGL